MADVARSGKVLAGVSIAIGALALVLGVRRAVGVGSVFTGGLWAGLACVAFGLAMYRSSQGRPVHRRIPLVVGALLLLLSLYSTFQDGRRHRRALETGATAPATSVR
jgi:hypothetical protein